MTKVWSWGCLAATVLMFGCNSPHLAISDTQANVPAGTSKTFSTIVQDSDGQVLWSLSGPGSLDTTSGPVATYTAPGPYDPAGQHSATITVRLTDASDQTRTIAITITQPSSTISGIAGMQANVTVTYDERDIPTLSCVKTTDCYAVLGYIHARDRFFEMDFLRRAGRGTLAELIGSAGANQDVSSRTVFTVRSRTAANPTAVALATELSAYLQTDSFVAPLFNAYKAGINYWIGQLRATPAMLPGEYKQLLYPIDPTKSSDVPDWADEDTVAAFRLQQFQLSATVSDKADNGKWAAAYGQGPLADPIKMVAWIRSKMPAPSYTLSGSGYPGTPPPVLSPGLPADFTGYRNALDGVKRLMAPLEQVLKPLHERAGSNNWVVDGAHSTSGKAMISNDPHLSLMYPSLFHLSHIISTDPADPLNLLGSAFPGVPVTLIGRGAHVGFGATVVGYDVTELYLEKLAKNPQGNPIGVVYNGNTVPFIVSQQSINVRTAQGMGTQALTVLIVPHHGPVISLDPVAGTAVSMRWTGHETQTDDAHAYYRLDRAASVADAMLALDGDPKPDGGTYTGYFTGAQNFILADDQGNIGYDPHACVPFRPWAAHMSGVYPAPATPVPGQGVPVTPVPLEWGDNLGLPLCVPKGLLPRADHSDKGFLATANSDPLGVGDDNNPYENNPNGVPYLSFKWSDGLGFRIQRIQSFLSSKIDAGTVSLDDLHTLQADHLLTLARPFLDALQAAGAPSSDNPNVSAGWNLLSQWSLDCPTGLTGGTDSTGLDPVTAVNDTNTTRSTDSAACLLFHTFLRKLLNATFADDAAIPGVDPSGEEAIRAFLWLVSAEGRAANPNHSLCSDVDTHGTKVQDKTCLQQATDALGWAYARLKGAYGAESNWRWGRVHTVTFANFLYPLVDQGYNPGPFARPGGVATVDRGDPSGGDPNNLNFAFTSAGNVRWSAVMDGTLANTTMQLPGLEVDGPFDPRNQGMLGLWLNNSYFNFPFQPGDVTSLRTETYSP